MARRPFPPGPSRGKKKNRGPTPPKRKWEPLSRWRMPASRSEAWQTRRLPSVTARKRNDWVGDVSEQEGEVPVGYLTIGSVRRPVKSKSSACQRRLFLLDAV